MPYGFKNLDLQQIYDAITGGGIPAPTGGATSANQVTGNNYLDEIDSLLFDIYNEMLTGLPLSDNAKLAQIAQFTDETKIRLFSGGQTLAEIAINIKDRLVNTPGFVPFSSLGVSQFDAPDSATLKAAIAAFFSGNPTFKLFSVSYAISTYWDGAAAVENYSAIVTYI